MDNQATSELKFRNFALPVFLIALACLINYVDRGNLSIAALTVQGELHITATQLGILLSAFFYTYTAFIFISGWLADRFNANWIFVIGFTLWSLATAATGLVHGFAMLLLMRLLLGAGESVIFPCSCKVLASFVPERLRGISNGLMTAGMKIGPAVGALGTGLLMAKYGWRPVFIGIGLISLLWLPAWMRVASRRESLPQGKKATSIGAFRILRQYSFWPPTVGHFCSNYVLYFMVAWLPYYLQQARGLSPIAMPLIASAYYTCDSLSAFSTGWITDRLARPGGSQTRVRKLSMAIGSISAAICLIGCAQAGPRTYLIWFMALGLCSGASGWGPLTFSQTFAGPQSAGKWAGLQNGFANFAGIFSPMVTGLLVHRTGSFTAPLAIAASVALMGAIAWSSVISPGSRSEESFGSLSSRETPLPSLESN